MNAQEFIAIREQVGDWKARLYVELEILNMPAERDAANQARFAAIQREFHDADRLYKLAHKFFCRSNPTSVVISTITKGLIQ